MSATPEALAWFDELESIYRLPDPALGRDVPSEVVIAAAGGAGARRRGDAHARADTRGVWLLIHASCLQRADGTAADVAVVIEPAKASEVAPLIVDAYELTPREVDVTRALARGLSTNEIARELHLSRYTSRTTSSPSTRRPASRAAASSWRRCSPTTTTTGSATRCTTPRTSRRRPDYFCRRVTSSSTLSPTASIAFGESLSRPSSRL